MRLLAALLAAFLLPASSLAVWTGSRWEGWWTSADAPTEWSGPLPLVLNSMAWHRVAPGVDWSEARLAGTGEAKRIRLIVARIDPRLTRFRLDTAFQKDRDRAAWSLDRAPRNALVAINAGQFPRSHPWGWVVLNGRTWQPAGFGPTSVGVGFDALGRLRWIAPDSLATLGLGSGIVVGFQSYPRLLLHGVIPPELRQEGLGVDLTHRDARAAIGETMDGMVLLAITRFDGANGLLDFVPFGLTAPEMAAVMGALGAQTAVMLDGGISSQLLIREPGATHHWRGLRQVPMGLLVEERR